MHTGIMHCCTGNCSCTLYYLWEHMLEHDGEQLRVNLLLNRASRWADIHSYVPYEGRVDIQMKQPCKDVLVRIPEWVQPSGQPIMCKVNGTSRTFRWEGRFLSAGMCSPGDRVSITLPIEERNVQERIGGGPYSLMLRGSTVVSIDPPGKNGPLYRRAQYHDQVAWRKVTRFVSQEQILW